MDTTDLLDEQENLVVMDTAEEAVEQYLDLLVETTIPLIQMINGDNAGEYLASLSDEDRETVLEQICLVLNLSIDWDMWDLFEEASKSTRRLQSEKNIN